MYYNVMFCVLELTIATWLTDNRSLPTSQRNPVYPGSQLHVKESTPSVQVPFTHGLGSQSLWSEIKHQNTSDVSHVYQVL